MKWMKILASALALSTFAIAQDNCSQKLDVLEKSLPQGSAQIRLTIAEARASMNSSRYCWLSDWKSTLWFCVIAALGITS